MKPGRGIRLILLACVAGVVGACLLLQEDGPDYEGRPLMWWLDSGRSAYQGSMEDRSAKGAILRIGTNGLPCLLDAIRYEHPAWRRRLLALENHLPRQISEPLGLYRIAQGSGERRADLAEFGFKTLGTNASAAVPQLAKLLDHTNPAAAGRAMAVLACVGKDGIGPLVSVLTNRQHAYRVGAAYNMLYIRIDEGDADLAVRALVDCLKDADVRVAALAAEGLGRLAIEPGACVPALTNQMLHSNAVVRLAVARSLSRFGRAGYAAVPSLRAALNDPNARVRDAATNALRGIAP